MVKFGDDSIVEIQGRGSIILECKDQVKRKMPNVYYIPTLKNNIISLGQLVEQGSKVIMHGAFMWIYDHNGALVMMVRKTANRLYKINLQILHPTCMIAYVEDEAWKWHNRLGHISFSTLRNMKDKDMVLGLPEADYENRVCDKCLAAKQPRNPFPS